MTPVAVAPAPDISGGSPARRGGSGSPRRRPWFVIGGVVAAAVVVGLVVWALVSLSGSRPEAVSIDESEGGGGLRGFVLLLEAFDAEVVRGRPPLDESDDVAMLIPGTRLSPADEEAMMDWVEAGGTMVTAGAAAPGMVEVREQVGTEMLRSRRCEVDALEEVGQLRVDPLDRLFEVELGGSGSVCFGTRGSSAGYVVVVPSGRGVVVGVGGSSPFTNRLLAEADNAVLATSLFAPEPGTRVVLVESSLGDLPLEGSGRAPGGAGGTGGGGIGGESDPLEGDPPSGPPPEEEGLLQLIPTGVRWGLLQLAVALALWALWKARRLGHPIVEPQPVPVAGSRLVDAAGTLLRRAGSPERAADLLRRDLRRRLTGRLGLPPDVDDALIAEHAATRAGADRALVLRALRDRRVTDDAALVALAADIDRIHEEVLHGVPT